MDYNFTTYRKVFVSTCFLLLPALYIFFDEVNSAVNWELYEPTHESYSNLTAGEHPWRITYYRGRQVLTSFETVLPRTSFGEAPAGATRLTLQTRFSPERDYGNDLAIHTGHIFARSWSARVNGKEVATDQTAASDHNIPLPRADTYDISYDLNISRISEPGFDLRANVLFGSRVKLNDIRSEIKERDHALVLWMVVPRLMIGVLFALGALIFVYATEYQLFALFSVLSGLKTAASYGEFGMYFPEIIDSGSLVNSLHLASLAILVLFLSFFFRRRSKWANWAAAGLGCLAVINLLTMRFSELGAPLFSDVFRMTTVLHQVVCLYGATLAFKTYSYLRRSKRSKPRLIISTILAVLFVCSVPALGYVLASSSIFWLGSSLFDLAYVVVMASCVSTDIGGVRAERDSIRRKLGVFVDESKVSDIISDRSSTKVWKENVAVMFIDVRNFCLMNEVFGPDAIFDAINDYYRLVIDTVYEHGGVVDKFIGDGVLAVWGIANVEGRPEVCCVRAAMALRKRIAELNASRLIGGKFPLAIGMGLHSGRLTYGLFGNDERAEFTVIGSTVNIAARVESYTKVVQSDILMSHSIYKLLENELVVCPRGRVSVVKELSSFEVFQPLGHIQEGVLVINDPLFEQMGLKAQPGVVEDAPPNLTIYDYTAFIGPSSSSAVLKESA